MDDSRPAPGGDTEWPRFLSGLVHELKTPLASLSMVAELLDRDAGGQLGDKGRRYVDNLRELTKEMQGLLGDAGALARLAAGRTPIGSEPVSLPELLERVEERARGQGWERGVSLTTTLDPGLPTSIASDGELLGEALERVLETVIAFADGAVSLRVAALGAEVVFTVDPDAGLQLGCDPEALFDPFQGGVSRKLRQRGARGLAPLLARELARALGGGLELVPRGGRTVAVLRVPVAGATEGA